MIRELKFAAGCLGMGALLALTLIVWGPVS